MNEQRAVLQRTARGGMCESMLRTTNEILEALRTRKAALGLSNAMVDELAGMTDGHFDKVAGPTRAKRASLDTFIAFAGALGLAVQLVPDPDCKVAERWEKRDERAAHGKRSGISKAALKKARTILLSEWATKANAKRWGRTTPEERAAVVAKLNAARARKRRRPRTRKAA